MSDQLVAEATTYTTHNKTQQKKIHAVSGIRTRNYNNEADLQLRPHGLRDRLG